MTVPEQNDGGRGFLERCVAGTGGPGSSATETIRERGSEAVLALYRLVKIGLIHSFENDAVGQTLDQTLVILQEFGGLAGGPVVVTFADDTVFVCGHLLRATRSAFETASELAALLLKCEISELRFEPSLTRADLKAAAQAISSAVRDGGVNAKLAELTIPNVTMQKVDVEFGSRSSKKRQEGAQGRKSLGYYASALVVMRRFFDDVAAGANVLPHRVKRIAQGLVGLAETENAALLGVTALANAHRDDAGRALQSAILTIVVAREMTADAGMVARMAMAALLADVGRVRLAGTAGRDRFVRLAAPVDREVPAMTGTISIGVSGVNAQSALHTVIVFEATWLERVGELGPPHAGAIQPFLQSRVVHLSRAMLELLAPRDNARSLSILDALEALTKNPGIDRALLRLLWKAVGVHPVGSVVELATGEWAVVVAPSRNPKAHARPRVRVVTDSTGAVVEPPEEWDLGNPPDGVSYPAIARNLPRDESSFNVTRALS
jgi:hypothetical protein